MKKIITFLLLTCSLTLFADDFFSDMDRGSELEVNGEINLDVYTLIDSDEVLDSVVSDSAEAIFTAKYSGTKADITVISKLNKNSIKLDECYTNIYFNYFTLDAGLLKTIWGKGDKLHVVDLLNPTDFSSYFENDYIENKVARPTLKVNIPTGINGMLEVAYIPTLQADIIPTSGIWEPIESKQLKSLETYLQGMYGASYTIPLSKREDGMVKNSQVGARFTSSISGFDYGVLYYHGYNTKPSLTKDYTLEYAKLNMFGLEFGLVLLGFNLRGEAAYYMVEDNYEYNMDSINYVAGFDRDIPLHNINLNLQVKGSYVMDAPEDKTDNSLVCKITDTFNHEKLELSVTGIYGVENSDYMYKPEINYKVGEAVELSAYGTLFGGDDDTLLGQYNNNDSLTFNIKYKF